MRHLENQSQQPSIQAFHNTNKKKIGKKQNKSQIPGKLGEEKKKFGSLSIIKHSSLACFLQRTTPSHPTNVDICCCTSFSAFGDTPDETLWYFFGKCVF